MTTEQKDPEIVLQEIIDDMVDNRKFTSYKTTEEWSKFFTALKRIVDSICRKTLKLEDDLDNAKTKYQSTYAEKEDYLIKYRDEKERLEKLQMDYETLEKDVTELFKIEKKFNDIKAK